MKKFDLIYESILNEAQDLKLNKFFELATKDLPDVSYERVKSYTVDKRLYTIHHKNKPIAYVVKQKRFIKPKFIMRPEDKNLKIKPIILPYLKGMKIKYHRMTPVVSEFTTFINKCIGK